MPQKNSCLSGSSHVYARAVITPSGRFVTLKEAASFLGIRPGKLTNIIKMSSDGDYRYESERNMCEIRVNPNSKRIMTPAGEFETITAAAIYFGISFVSMRSRSTSEHMPEFYILDALSI